MGPLKGVKVVEMAGIGPAPLCGMLLAGMGAEIIRVDRLQAADLGFAVEPRFDLMNRGKRAAAIDLKSAAGVAAVKRLAAEADILIEGFRPGVMERLGLGPDILMGANARLVFGRMTGWGQDGPLKDTAGHDINYIAMTGALHAIGPAGGPPLPPLNMVGDFGGGSLFLAMGVLAALNEARQSGRGQIVDAAMIDGAANLMTMITGFRQAGLWSGRRGANALDGGAPWYSVYETRDGKYMAAGAIEARFYAEMIEKLGLEAAKLPAQHDRKRWGEMRAVIAAAFKTKTRAEWEEVFASGDACVSPDLDLDECRTHPLAVSRAMYAEAEGIAGPAPAPRFSRTPGALQGGARDARADTRGALASWGFSAGEIDALAAQSVIAG